MSGNQKLSLNQKQIQKLSPQQIQLMKLIQLPLSILEQRIKEEIEKNPVLEISELGDELSINEEIKQEKNDNEDFDEIINDYDLDDFSEDMKSKNEADLLDHTDIADERDIYKDDYSDDFMSDDDYGSYKYNANNYSPDDDRSNYTPYSVKKTFQEYLIEQLGTVELSNLQIDIAKIIIGNIDDAGYLKREIRDIVNDLAFSYNIETKEKDVENVLKIIQGFDPQGTGARNLQECLLLQLQAKTPQDQSVKDALNIIKDLYIEFSNKHFDKIRKKLNISQNRLEKAIDIILKLNPKPGNSIAETESINNIYIIPDFIVSYFQGEFDIQLNSKNMPDLKINKTYTEMLEHFRKNKSQDKKALSFIKQNMESANLFIETLNQRQNTLLKTITSIIKYQEDYFKDGDETKLKPMILKDIALDVNLDISTISRVVSEKYVQTHFGTFSLKKFFSESLATDSGEEVSTNKIKKILQDCIDNEDKSSPLTDEELVVVLKEKGFKIARRTVAKYREVLDIPVARLRKGHRK